VAILEGKYTRIALDSGDPHGFRYWDDTQGTLTFTAATRQITITPTAAEGVEYYLSGRKYSITSAKNITVSNTEGLRYIALNASGTLVERGSFPLDVFLSTEAFMAVVYVDATAGQFIYWANERHSVEFAKQDWIYKHTYIGTQYNSGAGLTFTAGTDIDLDVAAGVIQDEDIVHTLAAKSTNFYKYYRDSSLNWRRSLGGVGYEDTGAIDVGGVPAFNDATSGGLSAIGNNNYVLSHIFLVNDVAEPVIAVVGQTEYTTITNARQGAQTEISQLVTAGLPAAEFVAAYTIIYKNRGGNLVSVATDDGSDFIDWRNQTLNPASGASPTSHNGLSDLQGGQGGEYFHLTSDEYSAVRAKYTNSITWSGSGPYTFSITAATHGKGVDPLVQVRESTAVVYPDIDIDGSGNVTITSTVNFSNGKVVIY